MTDETICEAEDEERQDVGGEEEEERVGASPDNARLRPDLIAIHYHHSRHDLYLIWPSDHQLDRREGPCHQPDGSDDCLGTRLSDAWPQRKVDDPEPIDSYSHDGVDADCDGHGLHEEDERAHGGREHPVTEHGDREGKWHAEDGHDEIGPCKVDEEPSKVSFRPSTYRENDDCQDVAYDGQEGGRRVEDNEQNLRPEGKPERRS